jgi:proteic killer suppression protein
VIGSFRNKALADLFRTGKTAKIDTKVHKRILARLDRLDATDRLEELKLPGFDFHALKGFKPTRYTIHVNGPWCITFEFSAGDAWLVDYEQHY